jgi:transposase
MPAFNMIKFKQTPFIDLYKRTFEKHGLKMKSYVAVQKKLLVLIYALWKNNATYDIDYKNKYTRELEQALPLGLASTEATLTNAV